MMVLGKNFLNFGPSNRVFGGGRRGWGVPIHRFGERVKNYPEFQNSIPQSNDNLFLEGKKLARSFTIHCFLLSRI